MCLLPINQTIDFNGRELKILKEIGSGYTSVVYEGFLNPQDANPIHVAIKVRKELNIQGSRPRFLSEANTIATIRNYEEKLNNQSISNMFVSLNYYGTGIYAGNDFFVIDFVEGKEILDLIEERSLLTEKEIISILMQFYRLLYILHTNLEKTFIDMKGENLWWAIEKMVNTN